MPAWLAPAIAGVAGFFGAKQQNDANRQMAREQMSFQERMSNTSWQRGVQDMKAAGLNPALAYSKGGAQVPGGATAQMENEVAPALSSAKQAALFRAELETAKANAERAKAEASSANTSANYDAAWLAAHGIVARKDGSVQLDLSYPGIRDQVQAQISSARSAAELARLQIPGAGVRSRVEGGKFGEYTEYLRRLFGATSPLVGGVGGAAVGAFMRKPTQIINYRR